MSQAVYTIPEPTKVALKRFRLSSSRAPGMKALIVKIGSDQDVQVEPEEYDSMDELVEELPDNSPRFVVLSYPITLSDGRKSVPYVMLYYRPPTCPQNGRMAYAGAVELVRSEAGVTKVIEIEDEEDFEDIENLIK
ncbi:protein Aim7p [Trichomonascus vanleenenianus]|uniref:Aim7p n=1 Tax=Trichomonascus vanleenenianus TaxID=2268995 RepID=UPI003EC9C226